MLFVVNPLSGNGRNAVLGEKISKMGCKVAYTTSVDQTLSIVQSSDDEVVVAVGGDGTVNAVARALLGSGRTLGIIPTGSGDGLARYLGLPRNNRKALDIVFKGNTRPLDVGVVDGHPFVSVCGVGFDALVSENFAKCGQRGLKNYIRQALRAWKKYKAEYYCIRIDGSTIFEGAATLITIGNSDQWGNNARIAPGADCSDGLLDVSVILPVKTRNLPHLALLLMNGHLNRSSRVLGFKGENICITRSGEGPAHIDGDNFHAGKMLNVGIRKGALKVISSK